MENTLAISDRLHFVANVKIPTFILHFGSKREVWQRPVKQLWFYLPPGVTNTLRPRGEKYFCAVATNTFGKWCRKSRYFCSPVWANSFQSGSDAGDDNWNSSPNTPIEYSLTEHHFHKKPLIQRVSKGGPLQFGCWAMVGGWVGPLTHLAPFYGHGKQIRGKVKTALDILCFILSWGRHKDHQMQDKFPGLDKFPGPDKFQEEIDFQIWCLSCKARRQSQW